MLTRGIYMDKSKQKHKNPGSPTGQMASGSQAAEVGHGDSTRLGGFEELRTSLKALRGRLSDQEGGYKLLFEKASHLELVSKKSQSPTVSSAIKELLEKVKKSLGCRGEVTSAFNVSWRCLLALASQEPGSLSLAAP